MYPTRDHRHRPTPPLFPFLVTPTTATRTRTPLVALGDRLGIALLELRRTVECLFFREDLAARDLDPVDAYLEARARLLRVVRAKLIGVVVLPGPWGIPCLSFHHPYLAASCIVLPDLFERAAQALACESLIAATPRRDLLIVAPDLGRPFQLAVRDVLRGSSRAASATTLFRLEPSGPTVMPAGPAGPSEDDAHAA